MAALIECVPNFSEGRDPWVIEQIVDSISSVNNIKLLHVDSGKAANRTVISFAGSPDVVVEAAFRGAKKAAELIDMRNQQGEHPRMGAMDVCPLIPLAAITLAETVIYANALAKRVGDELGIHVYCYGEAAKVEERKNLAYCRLGEYEGLKTKITQPTGKPDYGPSEFNAKSGASAIGVRNLLIAYNVNLATSSAQIAQEIAEDVREKGRKIKVAMPEKSTPTEVWKKQPGSLKSVKAIGWYIKEYGFAQVSMNLTDLTITPLHIAFDEVKSKAEKRNVCVTGSEIVGLVPLKSMLEAGRYFLDKKLSSEVISDAKLIQTTINALGLNQLNSFKPELKIIEYCLNANQI